MRKGKAAKKPAVKYVKVRISEEVQETTARWAERIVQVPSNWTSEQVEDGVTEFVQDEQDRAQWEWDDEDCDETDRDARVVLCDVPPTPAEISEAGDNLIVVDPQRGHKPRS
jgi:hypothetical protein